MYRRLAVVLTLGVFLGAFSPLAHAEDPILFDYVGYDYEFPDPDTLIFGEVGAGYVGLGFCPVIFPPLVVDTTTYEYTYHLSGLTSINRSVFGDFVIIDYSGPGTFRIYEDAATPADYGVNPPNGTAPSSFSDGTMILEGEVSNFQIILNTASGTGSFEGVFEAVGGTQLANIPMGQRDGWTFAGLTGNEIAKPEGYVHQVDGQVLITVVPVEGTSWGDLKRRFR
jgi:hypothetical protein